MKEFFGLEQTFKLVFLCSYDLTAATCGVGGDGYELMQLAKELLPAMRCAIFALKLANLASKVLFKVDVLGVVDGVVGGGVSAVSSGMKTEIEITPVLPVRGHGAVGRCGRRGVGYGGHDEQRTRYATAARSDRTDISQVGG